ncbi:DUF937 domain-containing protein [Ornithinimicrobium faecis]|uniref:DUF937 domain-containing protein n=1 Tax=Ornithinimicrobium faecis TaxID=2934158 RepID=A0ABY4YY15_9MICO|nr:MULTISPECIES: DUF937 domain-containing protein [unclassified Ornithinimicrobium]USQ81640.1 DUF937 domain-containing protein [Ornithinimicrobium sp. HY1793]
MSQYTELLSAIPMSQLAQQVGADEAEVEQAVKQVLPALVGGLSANAQQPEGAAALTGALSDHTDRDPMTDASTIDTDDGAKIVSHIFGNQSEDVVNQLGGLGGGAGSGLIKKLLPILAPIVLSWLARKLSGGGGLGGVLGDALGGDAPQQTSKDTAPTGQGGVGDLLGDLLGGALGKSPAQGQSGGFGLDDLLGGLLGGKR